MTRHRRDQATGWTDIEEEMLIGESAETAYLQYPGEEEEANDNFPAHEILQGCIWRDTASSLRRVSVMEDGEPEDRQDDPDRRRALDFSDSRRGSRGFLDDETCLYRPDPDA